MAPKDSKKAESAKLSLSPKVPSKSKDETKSSPKAFLLSSIVMAVIAFLGGLLTPPLQHMLRRQEDVIPRFVKDILWWTAKISFVLLALTNNFFHHGTAALLPPMFLCPSHSQSTHPVPLKI
jgi:hypothetical protein